MRGFFSLLAFSLACSGPAPKLSEPIQNKTDAESVTYCFAGRADYPESNLAEFCADSLGFCYHVRERAIQYAGLARIREIGKCRAEVR